MIVSHSASRSITATMASDKQPKSILKREAYPATPAKTKAERDHEVALYHANLIQQRKDIELEILFSMETLIDYPLAKSPYNASNPSPADAQTFKQHILPFRPSDYDDLITERNINEKCGYTLCANPRLKESGGGRYRLVYKTGRAKDFKVVEKGELEKWCSDTCAKRALYIKVQLNENPAWERGGIDTGIRIDLLDEPKSIEDTAMEGIQNLSINEQNSNSVQKGKENLALERGDTGGFSSMNGLVDVKIQEKDIVEPAKPPSMDDREITGRLGSMHLTTEGYTTSFSTSTQRQRNQSDLFDEDGIDEEDEDGGMDWQL